MKKPIFAAVGGLIVVLLSFLFGRTVPEKKKIAELPVSQSFDIQADIQAKKSTLSPAALLALSKMENQVKRGDVKEQQIAAFEQLANFWKDSANSFEGYAYYLSEAAKLENSEKKLTFAAHLISENIRGEQNEALLYWETETGIDLYNRALELDPNNPDLHIGLGSCYIYGRFRNGDPQQTMRGVQEVLAVVRQDSTNMKAQLLLGAGGLISGQYDKAVLRLRKVVAAQPDNAEATAYLADALAQIGQKEEAVKFYNISKRLINNPQYNEEADKRIRALQ